MLPFARQT
jgi:hypothetical protein